MVRNVIIIGSGPSGYTAAIYTARALLDPLVFEGYEPGGQLMITTEVENFPGHPEGITGPDLMLLMREQAVRFKAEFVSDRVTKVDFSSRPFRVWQGDNEYQALTVIISTGASAKWLDLPSEQALRGRGISSCATCDGAFFRDKEVMVVGGGDSALEEGLFLTRFASKVAIVHRRDQLRASKIMQDRAKANPKVEFIWNSVITEVKDTTAGKVTSATLKNVVTGEEHERPVDGIFVAVGHHPNSDVFKGQIEIDDMGYIITDPGTTKTTVPGVFAAGDVTDRVYRQAITAAGSGCKAAIDAERFLEAEGH